MGTLAPEGVREGWVLGEVLPGDVYPGWGGDGGDGLEFDVVGCLDIELGGGGGGEAEGGWRGGAEGEVAPAVSGAEGSPDYAKAGCEC